MVSQGELADQTTFSLIDPVAIRRESIIWSSLRTEPPGLAPEPGSYPDHNAYQARAHLAACRLRARES
jgi:hypothetical protein